MGLIYDFILLFIKIMDPSKMICQDNKIISKNKKKYYNNVNFDRTNSRIKYFLEKIYIKQ